jgi:type VI protein secretion system component VasF
MKLVFFNTPKPRQFNYPARYYDEEKEKREKRKKKLSMDGSETTDDFKSQLNAGWKNFRAGERGRQKKANTSVLIYIFIVIILVYLIFFR